MRMANATRWRPTRDWARRSSSRVRRRKRASQPKERSTTQGGLQIRAERDTSTYPTKVSVPKAEMAALTLTRHAFHGAWNDTIHPPPPPRHV